MSVICSETPLLLGSASPRRRELLQQVGLPLRVHAVGVEEEQLPGETPERYVRRVTDDKLRATQRSVARSAAPIPHAAILVADTIVVLDDEVLGKPSDTQDAVRLLGRLVARTHVVNTCYQLARPSGSACAVRVVRTEVEMRPATTSEIRAYAASGEGLDKAGAYALQGLGAFLVRAIRGSHANVIGLPVCEVVEDLLAQGLLAGFPLRGPEAARAR